MSRRRTGRHAAPACPGCTTRDNTIIAQHRELQTGRAEVRRLAARCERAVELMLHLARHTDPDQLSRDIPVGAAERDVVLGEEVLRVAAASLGLTPGTAVRVEDGYAPPGSPGLPGRITGHGFTSYNAPVLHVTMDDPDHAAQLNKETGGDERPDGVVFVVFPRRPAEPIADGGWIEVQS